MNMYSNNRYTTSTNTALIRRRTKTDHDRRRAHMRLTFLVGFVLLSSSSTTKSTVLVQSLSTATVKRPFSSSTSKSTRKSIVENEQQLAKREPFVSDEGSFSLHEFNLRSPQLLSYDSVYSGAAYTLNSNIDEELDDDDDDDDEEESNYMIRDGLQNYRTLLHATGSEIVQGELLQHQIKTTNKKSSPAHFIQQYDATSNEMEILAMNSITEQLPHPVMRTLEQPSNSKATKTRKLKKAAAITAPKYSENLNFEVNGRVSVEEEIYLAQMIQMGAKLQQVKQELQNQSDGVDDVSRNEWAQAVQMTPKQLRQTLSAIRNAKHQLVTANIGLVHAVVKQQFGQSGKAVGITTEELVQEGSIGLLRAAELYDPDRGVRFSTYAVTWIKGILLNSHVTELVRVPSREKTKYNKIKKAQSDFMKTNLGGSTKSHQQQQQQQPMSNAYVEELALMTGLTVKDVIETERRMSHVSNMYSLDYQQTMHSRSGSESSTIESTLTKQTNSMRDDDDLMELMQLQTDVIAAMARNLDAREARLLRLRYGLASSTSHHNIDTDGTYDDDASAIVSGGRTLQECADAMGLSYSRVHQLNERCLKKLRQAVEAESLEEYFLTIA